MTDRYITSEADLPEDGGEVTLQITDAETKEIFRTRARVATDPAHLSDPTPLTVVSGPHENTEERRYIEVVDDAAVDEARLRRLLRDQRDESNVVNTRSDDLKVLLRYLVETERYDSTSEAARDLLFEHIASEYPAVLDAYADARDAVDPDPVRDALERVDGA